MRPTLTLLGEKAREAITKGVKAIHDPVRRTMGPEGKNGLIYRTHNRGHRITNDGFTIAEVQEPKDEFIKIASSAFKEAAKKTNQKAGDGTTSTTVIAGKLINDAFSSIADEKTDFELVGVSASKIVVIALKKKIISTIPLIKEAIAKQTKKIKTIVS